MVSVCKYLFFKVWFCDMIDINFVFFLWSDVVLYFLLIRCVLECINYFKFILVSDVWVYGVIFWEMFIYGF